MSLVKRYDYIQIDVTYITGFKFSIPARGYNLKSWIEFQESLSSVKKHTYKIITKEEYDKLFYGEEIFGGSTGDTTKRRRNSGITSRITKRTELGGRGQNKNKTKSKGSDNYVKKKSK